MRTQSSAAWGEAETPQAATVHRILRSSNSAGPGHKQIPNNPKTSPSSQPRASSLMSWAAAPLARACSCSRKAARLAPRSATLQGRGGGASLGIEKAGRRLGPGWSQPHCKPSLLCTSTPQSLQMHSTSKQAIQCSQPCLAVSANSPASRRRRRHSSSSSWHSSAGRTMAPGSAPPLAALCGGVGRGHRCEGCKGQLICGAGASMFCT